MKKYYLFAVLCLTALQGFSADDMQFVTNLSAPIAVFDKVDATDASQYTTAKKATIGVLTRSGKPFATNVQLKGKKGRLETFQLSSNTTLGNNPSAPTPVSVWRTPTITVRNGGGLTGKQMLTNELRFSSGSSSTVHNVNATGTIQVANNINLATAKAINSLYVGTKTWYETTSGQLPTTGGDATWGTLSGTGPTGTGSISNILFYNGN